MGRHQHPNKVHKNAVAAAVALVVLAMAGCASSHRPPPSAGLIGVRAQGSFIEDYVTHETDLFTQEDREKAAKVIQDNHDQARYAFFTTDSTLTKVAARFCLAGDYKDPNESDAYNIDRCHWAIYIESIVLVAAIAFILAIVIFPCMFVGIGVGRCCCCGRWKPTPQLCCGSGDAFDPDTDGYTFRSVVVVLVVACVCAAIALAGSITGLYGNAVMTRGVDKATEFTSSALGSLAGTLVSTVDTVIGASLDLSDGLSDSDQQTILTTKLVAETTQEAADAVVAAIEQIDTPRQVFMYFTLLVPLVLFALLILSCPFCAWLGYFMVVGGFIFSAMALATFGVHFPLASGLADACQFLDNATDPTSPNYDRFMKEIFDCGPDSPITLMLEKVKGLITGNANGVCSEIEAGHLDGLLCDTDGDGKISSNDKCSLLDGSSWTECNSSSLPSIINNTRFKDWKLGCFGTTDKNTFTRTGGCPYSSTLTSFTSDECSKLNDDTTEYKVGICNGNTDTVLTAAECKESCTLEELRTNASLLHAYSVVDDALTNTIEPYFNCETVRSIALFLKDFVCIDMVIATTPIFVGEAFVAVACFAGTFVAMIAVKRFDIKNRRGTESHEMGVI